MAFEMTQSAKTGLQTHTPRGMEAMSKGPKSSRRDMMEWDKYRDFMEDSYMNKNEPLPSVMKEMSKRFGFERTYMFGEKWQWKKYGQSKPKHLLGRKRERIPRYDSSDSNEEESVVSTIESATSSRDIASLRTLLSTLFNNQSSDEESLSTLKGGNPRNVSKCIRLCFCWCAREIGGCEAPLLFPCEEDSSESKYDLDARVFIYFLDRYIESAKSPAKHNDWDNVAECSVKFSPIKMLFTMSTLIVVAVSNAKRVAQEDPSLNIAHVFDLARLGIDEIKQNRWGDKKLAAEFCNDFESILGDYVDYGKAINSAICSYERQKWSQDQAVGVLEFGDGGVYHDESWADNMQGGDEITWPLDGGLGLYGRTM